MFEFLFKAAFTSCRNDCIWEMSVMIFYEHQLSELGSCHLKKHGEY